LELFDMRQEISSALEMALATIREHKLRSFLTVLGVIIGTTTVIAVGSIIAGLNESVVETIQSFGTNTAFASRLPTGPRFGRLSREERLRKYLTPEDAQALLESCPDIVNVAPSIFPSFEGGGYFSLTARYKGEEVVGLDYRGTMPAFFTVYGNASIKEGRYFTEAENEHKLDVIVVGEDLARALFSKLSGVGKTIQVAGHSFEVIGVMDRPRGGFAGAGGEDRRAVIPYATFRKIHPNAKEIGVRFEAREGRVNQAVDQARGVLRQRRHVPYDKPDDFSIATADGMIEQFHEITGAVALVMVVLSSIGLMVGGIGVMNIMLVSVTERTREIGVRKALGARRVSIVWQFLLEAMTLTAGGGLLGIGLGIAISAVVRWLLPSLPSTVPLWSVVAGLAVSISVGLFFGLWPAVKASRMDPVVALRYE
jgi:putative ABC transport system permease protein